MAPIDYPFSCPWEDSSSWTVHADNLAPPGYQNDKTPYLAFVRHLNARLIIGTYGSATLGTLSGDPAHEATVRSSSYDEEEAAMR